MRINTRAALKVWSVDVDLAGRTCNIPPLPAVDWIVALDGGWLGIVPGLVAGGRAVRRSLLRDGSVTLEECERAAQDALGAVSGTRWWTAYKLVQAAVSTSLAGELLLRGVDPGRVSLGAWLLAAHRLATTRYMDAAERARWEFELDKPPPGVPVGEMLDEAEAASNFMALMASGG